MKDGLSQSNCMSSTPSKKTEQRYLIDKKYHSELWEPMHLFSPQQVQPTASLAFVREIARCILYITVDVQIFVVTIFCGLNFRGD